MVNVVEHDKPFDPFTECWPDKGILRGRTPHSLLGPGPVAVHEEHVHHPIEGCILDLPAFMPSKEALVLLFREPKEISALLLSPNAPRQYSSLSSRNAHERRLVLAGP
jgi:hypothetical protein